ncbi:MAG: class I SAM-dependent methyltransferase [Woeseiaceae bacterium]|nr:class I SAM-dependent methyltransferase [Woeseiaceae bacterium]
MKEQQIQEAQYRVPYHYLPKRGVGGFRQHDYWSWGFRYLGGMHVVQSLCDEDEWTSLLDLGCGDGRFLSDLGGRYPDRRLVGIDYSERAIALANALNEGVEYRAADIIRDDTGSERFDVVTLVEVLEHIPLDDVPAFVASAVDFVKPGGRLVLTVPHNNNPVSDKHFQHFDSGMLRVLFEQELEDLRLIPFDFFSRKTDIWFRLLGRTGKYFLVTWPPVLDAFYRHYIENDLFGGDESECSRIAMVGRRPQ